MRGGQHQVMLLLRLLSQAGHEVTLLAREDAPLYQAARSAGFLTKAAGLRSVYQESSSVDIVHAHDARAHTLAALGARRPFVVSRRVAFPVRGGLSSRWKYARAARYLAVSDFVARQLRTAGINRGRIDTVYDAVESVPPAAWDPAAPAVALQSDDPGKCRRLVEDAAARAGIPMVFSSHLPRDLQRASMFVYLTGSEGLGSAAILAMAMGIPVVASRMEGLAEVFESGISGLYTANDPVETAALMRSIIETPGLGERLSIEGRKRAQAKFSTGELLERTLGAYRMVLGE
jgi:hypothetical protein